MRFFALLMALVLLWPLPGAQAAPVQWQEVPASSEGQQWWDSGSLRLNRNGELTVLSRFSPAAAEGSKRPAGELYVMALDCQQQLYRDTQVNGLPKPRSQWQPAASEGLVAEVLRQACEAARNQGLIG
jgi:hypothetical protein